MKKIILYSVVLYFAIQGSILFHCACAESLSLQPTIDNLSEKLNIPNETELQAIKNFDHYVFSSDQNYLKNINEKLEIKYGVYGYVGGEDGIDNLLVNAATLRRMLIPIKKINPSTYQKSDTLVVFGDDSMFRDLYNPTRSYADILEHINEYNVYSKDVLNKSCLVSGFFKNNKLEKIIVAVSLSKREKSIQIELRSHSCFAVAIAAYLGVGNAYNLNYEEVVERSKNSDEYLLTKNLYVSILQIYLTRMKSGLTRDQAHDVLRNAIQSEKHQN